MTHPEDFGGEPVDPSFFQGLEASFDGIEERAEAIHANDEEQRLRALKAALIAKGVISEQTAFEAVRWPSYANGGILAQDGYPLVLCPEDAEVVAQERPDIAERVDQKVRAETGAARQQLAIDIARAGDDAETLARLHEERTKLDQKAERVTFWSTIALLHPFNSNPDEPVYRLFTDTVWLANDFDSRVHMLLGVEEELHRLESENAGKTSAAFDAYESAYGHDPQEKRYVDRKREHTEENAIKIQRYRTLLDDVTQGRITTTELDKPMTISNREVTLSAEATALKDLVGQDPVQMVLDGKLDAMPQDGWLIVAKEIAPGAGGGMTLYRYNEGGLSVFGAKRDDVYGQHYIDVHIDGAQAGAMTLAYQKKSALLGYDGCAYSTARNVSIADHNDKEIRHNLLPMRAAQGGGTYMQIRSEDVEERVRTMDTEQQSYDVARVTDSPDEAKQIIARLFEVMGSSNESVQQLLGALEVRDVFSDLRVITDAEAAQFDATLQAREPAPTWPAYEDYDPDRDV